MPSRPASPTVAVEPNSKCRVMVVDDDITTSTIIGAGLQRAGFQVFKAASGMACLEQIDQVEPEVLIIDIMMPEMDGYETCRRVRKTYGPEILSIIFLSGQDSLDDRLNAYEAGGDDFMSKPFSVKEVCRKIEAEVSLKHSWREYAKAARERESATAAVMDSLRESTVELSFTRRTLNCRTLQALAELATQSMSSYALTCHVQIRIPATTLTWTADGEACPLEVSVFDRTSGLGRMFQFKSRFIVNYERFSLLIVNMPVDDEVLSGNIRDTAAMIAEAGDAAVENIVVQMDARDRARQLSALAADAEGSITDLHHKFELRQSLVRQELQRMVSWIEGMYYRMGLSDQQEEMISRTAHETVSHVMALMEESKSYSDEFTKIITELRKASELALPDESLSSGNDVDIWF